MVVVGFMCSSVVCENDHPLRYAKHFFGSDFYSGAALSVLSVEIEDEYGAVFAADLGRLAGVGALVEEVETPFRIVVGNPFPDGLPRRLNALEGVRVERWVG